MSNTPPPIIRIIDQGISVRFPPQRHWGFVSTERFELRIDAEIPMSELRHHHAQLTDVSLSVSMRDLERLLHSRLERSDFKEIHLVGAKSKTSGQPTPLMCWGVFQPPKQREQLFYLEGGFHALAHSLRFEFYQGVLFGLGELNAQSLAAHLLKEAGLPAQRTHPTVLNLDPLTELSLAYCLDWGWKLPKRRLESEIDISAQEISFIAGKTRESYLQSSYNPTAHKITPQQEVHLNQLRKFYEGEGLIHAEEYESAKIFFKSHSDDPRGATRYFELARWLGEPEEHLKTLCEEYHFNTSDLARAEALIAEGAGRPELAIQYWNQFIEAELNLFRNASISSPTERSPLSLHILRGLKNYTIGLLIADSDPQQSLENLEKARSELGVSCYLLKSIATTAVKCGDTILAQARLTECAQHQALFRHTNAAADTWVLLGELWIEQPEGYDHAERAYRRALELEPTSLSPYYSLAHLNELRGDLIAAKALLERILELSPYAKRARDILNRLALEADQPLRAVSVETKSMYAQGDITRLPQETQDQLKPVPSPAPVPKSDEDHDSLIPPPRPLSAGPFVQSDPWSLAPQESIDDWLNEHQSSEQGHDLTFQDLIPEQLEALSSIKAKETAHAQITAAPSKKPSEKITKQPRSETPTIEPSDPPSQKEEDVSSSSERITLPPPDSGSKIGKVNHEDTKKPPIPPRAGAEPPKWNSGDLDVLNIALSLAHPQTDSGVDHPVARPYTPVIDKETRPPRSERSTLSPAQEQPPELTKSDENTSVDPSSHQSVTSQSSQRVLAKPKVSEETKSGDYLQVKAKRMEAALDGILSTDEAQDEVTRLEAQLKSDVNQEAQAQLALDIAVIYRDQLLDIANAKAWFWDGLKRSPNEHVRHELNESLAELFTVTQDWEGLLEYYLFIANQEWSDAGESHLQRASLLKTLNRPQEAISACDLALDTLSTAATQSRSGRKQDRYEETLRLKADLLSSEGQHETAVNLLLEPQKHLELSRSALRHAYAARILATHNQERASALYQMAYKEHPKEDLLEEWLSHVNHWGDPYARASAVRAAIQSSQSSDHRMNARRLAQLADEISEMSPLLSIELYQESLSEQIDLDIVERLIAIAEQRDQYHTLVHGLDLLIPECFEGEYRGLLKLKKAFSLYILKDERAAPTTLDALIDFDGPILSGEEFTELLEWAENRCSKEDYHQVLTWLDSVNAFGTPTPSE